MKAEREQWFAVGTGVWVFATRTEVKRRGWYARRADGSRLSITRIEGGQAVLEQTTANGWETTCTTHCSVQAAKRAA